MEYFKKIPITKNTKLYGITKGINFRFMLLPLVYVILKIVNTKILFYFIFLMVY